MQDVVKVLLVISILFLTFGFPVILQMLTSSKKAKTVDNEKVVEVEQQQLKFVSVPPQMAIKGGQYIYQPTLTAGAGDTISVSVSVKPDWLKWNSDLKSLVGEVPADVDSFSITLNAESNSGQTAKQSFTVTVESAESVKGVANVNTGTDPFHPTIVATTLYTTTIPSTVTPTQTQEAVLGANTQQQPVATFNVPYLVAAILLTLIAIVLFMKLWALLFSKNTLNSGSFVIQRGRV